MKKILRITLCLILSLSVLSLFACGGDNTFEGNFKHEATEEELTQLAGALSSEDLVADSNNIGFNLSLTMSSSSDSSFSEDYTQSSDMSFDFDMKMKVTSNGEDAPVMKMSMDGKFNIDVDVQTPSKTSKTKVSGDANAYADATGLYIGYNMKAKENGKEESVSEKTKFSIEEFGAVLEGLLGSFTPEDPDVSDEPGDLDFSALISKAEELGLKVYVDASNGYKVKISIPYSALSDYIEDVDGDITLNTCDLYITLDKDNRLVGIKFEIEMENTSNSIYTGNTTATAKITLIAKIADVNISTPSNLSEYAPGSLEDLFGGIM